MSPRVQLRIKSIQTSLQEKKSILVPFSTLSLILTFLFHDDINLKKSFPDIGDKNHVLELVQSQYKTMLKIKASMSWGRPCLSHNRDTFTHMEKQNSSEKWLALAIANLFIKYRISLKNNNNTGGVTECSQSWATAALSDLEHRNWKMLPTLHCGILMVNEWCKHFSPIPFFIL